MFTFLLLLIQPTFIILICQFSCVLCVQTECNSHWMYYSKLLIKKNKTWVGCMCRCCLSITDGICHSKYILSQPSECVRSTSFFSLQHDPLDILKHRWHKWTGASNSVEVNLFTSMKLVSLIVEIKSLMTC